MKNTIRGSIAAICIGISLAACNGGGGLVGVPAEDGSDFDSL